MERGLAAPGSRSRSAAPAGFRQTREGVWQASQAEPVAADPTRRGSRRPLRRDPPRTDLTRLHGCSQYLQDSGKTDGFAMKVLKFTMPAISMSEDCLYLNIYTPTHAHEGTNMPVSMVTNLPACEKADSEALVNCLRGKSEEEMLTVTKDLKLNPGVVDGIFLPRHPQELLASGDFQPVSSVNNDEFGWIIPRTHPAEFEDLVMEEYVGDSSHAPIYFYEFHHRPNIFKDAKPPYMKADHGNEILFIFGGSLWGNKTWSMNSKWDTLVLFLPATDFIEEEMLLSRRRMKYWANFARSGNPNGEDLPHWPALDHEELYLKLDIQLTVGHPLKAAMLKFWTKPLPQKIQELKETDRKHTEL
ncbi:acylcarnitine hydrolase-like [Ctenodactylus gundi]